MKLRVISFIKRETILTVSFFLALLSCFLVKPDREYLRYFTSNMGTMIILFCLMAVVAGLGSLGVFRYLGERLLERIRSQGGIMLLLVFLCFFGSMLITNDVALITFVPFGIMILEMAAMREKICCTVTLMTIGANLGSMFTPMGNPQNLYLYGLSGMKLLEFLFLMLPLTAAAAFLLALSVVFYSKKGKIKLQMEEKTERPDLVRTAFYVFLFLLCLQTVNGTLPAEILLILILAAVAAGDKRLFAKVDYSLLLTFLCFFVFIGNINRFGPFRELAVRVISGHELAASVIMSQVISNVPAALLLSNFTQQWELLIVGTNLGGLGTLIASMASLISYKQIAARYPEKKTAYLRTFTFWNVIFLAALWIMASVL